MQTKGVSLSWLPRRKKSCTEAETKGKHIGEHVPGVGRRRRPRSGTWYSP